MIRYAFLSCLLLISLVSSLVSCSNAHKGSELGTRAAESAVEDLNQANDYYHLGLFFDIRGDFDQALLHYLKALEINPRHAQALNSLAWFMATCPDGQYRNGPRAVEFAKTAVALSDEPDFLDTLAAAYAEAGNFEKAIEVQNRLLHTLAENGKTKKLSEYHAHLSSYKAHAPWRKNNRVKAHSPSTLKAEPGIPDQASEEKTAQPKQHATVPSPEESAVKIGTSLTEHAGEKSPGETAKTFYPYTIHVSSYQDKEKSNDQADDLKNRGAPAFACPVRIPGKGDWYRVFVGWYETIEEARKAASELRGNQDIHPLAIKMPYAVQVGIFDSDDELKKLETLLRSKAYMTYRIPDGKPDHRVRLLIGAYKTEEDASRLAQQLQTEGFSAKVVLR